LLKKINPSLETTTRTTVEIIRTVERQYRESLSQLRQNLFVQDPPHIKVKKSGLKQLEPALLADLVGEYGFNLDQCRSVLGPAIKGTGKIFRSNTHVMNVDRDEIIISPNPRKKDAVEIQKNIPGTIQVNGQQWSLADYPAEGYDISTASDVGAFDLDKLVFPLMLRQWQPGDQFFPLGMTQSKKLSDFLIDSKVPLNYKPRIQVLLSGKEVIWVVGHRIDERYKITGKTKTVLEIKLPIARLYCK
jgi:tRNA(Ile)-lysidine synthase